jgi:hypothetical protein
VIPKLETCLTPIVSSKPSLTHVGSEVLTENNGKRLSDPSAILSDIASVINDAVDDGKLPVEKVRGHGEIPAVLRKIITMGESSIKLAHLRKKI